MRKAKSLTFALILSAVSGTAHSADLTFNTQDFAPFSYQVDGVVSGPATEIILKVCARINAKCTFVLLPWKRAQQEVKLGKVNGMFVIGWNKGRATWVHFSPPIMKTEYGFFVHQSNELTYKDPRTSKG